MKDILAGAVLRALGWLAGLTALIIFLNAGCSRERVDNAHSHGLIAVALVAGVCAAIAAFCFELYNHLVGEDECEDCGGCCACTCSCECECDCHDDDDKGNLEPQTPPRVERTLP